MKHIHTALLLSFLFLGCNATKSLPEAQPIAVVDTSFIDELFKDYSGNRPSASVIVIKDGEIEIAKSYGFANIEKNELATPSTNYRIASVTKQFTCMAIMLLVEQGKLSYTTTLTEIFPEFPAYGSAISIQDVMTHRSGLVSYNRFLKDGQTEQMLDKDVLAGLLGTDSTYFPPGSKYRYCNTGYAVLAMVVEKISGQSFAEFMKQQIFEPLEMTNSTILEIDKKIENRAYGYIVKDTSVTAKDQSLTSAIQGDGGVYTSVMDYYKWDQALYTNKLLPQNVLDAALYNYDEAGKSDENGYGYGWSISYYKGIKILKHGGSSKGFGSHVIRIPSENLSVAIFTNRNKRGQELANKSKALISHFTEGKFQMPFEIVLEQEIDKNGIASGIELYNKIKADTANYSVTKEGLFYFGISYINANRNSDAIQLFSALATDYPEYFGGYYGSAIIYKQEKNTEKALEHLEKTIKYSNANQSWAADHAREMIKELTE